MEIMSRYRPRYREYTQTDVRVYPDIAVPDIVSSRHDIVSFFPISDPILVILVSISGQYRDIPVPCQIRYYQYRARYRFFSRYLLRYRVNTGTYPFLAKPDIVFFTDIVPDMVQILQKISEYTDIRTKKPRCHSRCVCNIAIYRYRVLLMSGRFSRYRGRYITCCASAPRPPHWPLPRCSNRSCLLVLGPPGLSVHHGDTPDTLPECLAHLTARNAQFYRPTSREKGGGDVSWICVMAVAADKLC
jgi:hypothetical protein